MTQIGKNLYLRYENNLRLSNVVDKDIFLINPGKFESMLKLNVLLVEHFLKIIIDKFR